MEAWQNFFLAQVGASAALAGLIFVSVSISLAQILASPHLTLRALQALAVLLEILIVSSLMLVPGQGIALLGAEVLILGALVWIMVATFDLRNLRGAEATYRRRTWYRTALSQTAALLYVVAGCVILASGLAGLYWLVPAMLSSFLIAMLDAWVLLVEIKR